MGLNNLRKNQVTRFRSLIQEREQTDQDIAINEAVDSRFIFNPKGKMSSQKQSLFDDPHQSQQASLTIGGSTKEMNH